MTNWTVFWILLPSDFLLWTMQEVLNLKKSCYQMWPLSQDLWKYHLINLYSLWFISLCFLVKLQKNRLRHLVEENLNLKCRWFQKWILGVFIGKEFRDCLSVIFKNIEISIPVYQMDYGTFCVNITLYRINVECTLVWVEATLGKCRSYLDLWSENSEQASRQEP